MLNLKGNNLHRHKGFTLIELLVVVAIIALLVSILVPSLTKAKEMARQVACQANQRTITLGLVQYDGDKKMVPLNYGYYYESPDPNAGKEFWALDGLREYYGGMAGEENVLSPWPGTDWEDTGRGRGEFPAALLCPSIDWSRIAATSRGYQYHRSYWTNNGIRQNRGWGYIFDDNGNNKPPGWDYDSGGGGRIYGRNCAPTEATGGRAPGPHWRSVYFPTLSSIPNSGQAIFLGDTSNGAVSTVTKDGAEEEIPAGYFDATIWKGDLGLALGFDRHDGQMMVSYADGHGARITEAWVKETEDNRDGWLQNGRTGGSWLYNLGGGNDPGQCTRTAQSMAMRFHYLNGPVCE